MKRKFEGECKRKDFCPDSFCVTEIHFFVGERYFVRACRVNDCNFCVQEEFHPKDYDSMEKKLLNSGEDFTVMLHKPDGSIHYPLLPRITYWQKFFRGKLNGSF